MGRTLMIALAALAGCRGNATPVEPPSAAAIAPAPGRSTVTPSPELEPPARLPNGMLPLPSGPIAVVDGVEIPAADFHAIYDLKIAKYAARGRELPASADRRYRQSIAGRLIHHELLRQAAAALGVAHDPAAVARREAQAKHGIGDWEQHLERRGETEQSLRDMYVAELLEEAIIERRGALAVGADEIEAEYQRIKDEWSSREPRVRASHILVPFHPLPPDAPEQAVDPAGGATPDAASIAAAKRRALEIHRRVTQPGVDFAEVARSESSGPSAARGGDLGIFDRSRMVREFSDAAFALRLGAISKPVRTKLGFHIIKLTGKWPPGELPRSALEDDIVTRLRQRKLSQGRRALKEQLLANATIVDHIAPTLGPGPDPRPIGEPVRVGGGTIGIVECDAVISEYTACVAGHVPAAAQAAAFEALEQTARAWREAKDAIGHDALRDACLEFRRSAKQATTALGCSWR